VKPIERINPTLARLVVPIGRLREDPQDARTHDDRSLEGIEASLRAHGQQKPVVADRDGKVIAGNGILLAARRLGWKRLAVAWFDGRGGARSYAIADNRTGELSTWDPRRLQEQIDSVLASSTNRGEALVSMGFTEDELEKLLKRLSEDLPEPPRELDQVPPLPRKPKTRRGDLWVLGEHRLLCGDSTDPESYARLMGTERAAMVHTDPPYGVSYKSASGKFDAICNDDRRLKELHNFLYKAFRSMLRWVADLAAFYIWHASETRIEFSQAMAGAGLLELQQIIWVKNSFVLGRADYQWAHEPCFYASKDGKRPRWYGGRAQQTAWYVSLDTALELGALVGTGVLVVDEHGGQLYITGKPPKGKRVRKLIVPKDGRIRLESAAPTSTLWEVSKEFSAEHPTQKPVELARRAIENSSKTGEIVLDSFLGSGCTLIGAEVAGRRCFGLELDPKYCDVIVSRWEQVSGRKAKRE
jgi:DNA modification methylase